MQTTRRRTYFMLSHEAWRNQIDEIILQYYDHSAAAGLFSLTTMFFTYSICHIKIIFRAPHTNQTSSVYVLVPTYRSAQEKSSFFAFTPRTKIFKRELLQRKLREISPKFAQTIFSPRDFAEFLRKFRSDTPRKLGVS